MLKRVVPLAISLLALATITVVVTPRAAFADGYVYCPPDNGPCILVATSPGGGGGGGGGGGNSGAGSYVCTFEGKPVDCHNDWGWYNPDQSCYYKVAEPQPPLSDPSWYGHTPADGGKIYTVHCLGVQGAEGVGNTWLQDPPTGYGGITDPILIAIQAINLLGISAPPVDMSLNPFSVGLVGVPVWLAIHTQPANGAVFWVPQSNPVTKTVSAGPVTVTAWAYSKQIVWDMGDGHTVTCDNPGTEYNPSFGGHASPTCGYTYGTPSRTQANGYFTVTVTTTWVVWWQGGGRTADPFPVQRTSTTTVNIQELQVLRK